jgi:methyltransferase (TIGR00027 family)
MKQDQRSRTAEATAAIRAYHILHDNPIVFEDPFAIQLTSPTWRLICGSRILAWLVMRKILGALRPAGAYVLGRSRYAEDQLEKAIREGVDQYVLVGAGLDSFALRRQDLATRLKVYELDHPASQDSKRNRLAQLNISSPKNLMFISVDFENESISDALEKSSFSRERRTFFSWLGTTGYLSRVAVFRTLESILSCAAPGSEIVFDYDISKEFVDSADLLMIEKVERFTARRGEPLISSFDPKTFPQEVCNLGFELVENLSPKKQEERYFYGRKDNFRPSPSSYLAHFRMRT